MDPNTRALIMGAAGAGSAEKIYVEDVFSTWLYTGNGSTQTITNGIDLSGKGGLVWIKDRSAGYDHRIYDTARGVNKYLSTNLTSSQTTTTGALTAFNSNGFSLGPDDYYSNFNGVSFSSWTFRKAAKFFDVVTYTGNGVTNRAVPHSLGSTPGCIIVKETSASGQNWHVWHRSLNPAWTGGTTAGDTTGSNNTGAIYLNTTDAFNSSPGVFTYVNSTAFGVYRANLELNSSGSTYVAYLFAHDAGGFGDSGNDSVSACGSFTTDGSGNATITLGWEPQWVLVKKSSTAAGNATDDWFLYDTMRGADVSGGQKLAANTSNAESSNSSFRNISPTGFGWSGSASATYIYIAIRRGPMKTPTDATKVYENVAYTGDQTSERVIGTSALVDFFLLSDRDATSTSWTSYAHYIFDRLRGRTVSLATALTNAEGTGWGGYVDFDRQTGWDTSSSGGGGYLNKTSTKYVSHNFRRAPGFFDAVCYTGTGSALAVNHNLGVAPELIISKSRSNSMPWYTWVTNKPGELGAVNDASAFYSTGASFTSVSSSAFNLPGGGYNTNLSTYVYVAYLFASCPGVSKVGSYTGTGTTLSVNCGFTNGAQFVLIKRTDSTGDWYVWDTARGIIANNDPYLLLNSTAAEVTNTDYIDPLSSGFQISSTAPAAINANGGSYIYLAIA